MGARVSVVVRPALWSSNRLLGLLELCAAPVGVWVLWDYRLATSTLTHAPSHQLASGGEGGAWGTPAL